MQIHIRINDEIHKKLKELKEQKGISFSWIVNKALKKYFNLNQKRNLKE